MVFMLFVPHFCCRGIWWHGVSPHSLQKKSTMRLHVYHTRGTEHEAVKMFTQESHFTQE